MRIDSHHHLWSFNAQEFGWIPRSMSVLHRDFTAGEFDQTLRTAGYEGSIAVQARQSADETRFLLETARDWPFLKGVVGWVDLASDTIEAQLDKYQGSKLVGVRHVVQAEPTGFLLRPEILRGLRAVQRQGLVYELLLFPGQLGEALALLDRLPELNIVLDHLGKPMEGDLAVWRSGLEHLAQRPQVSVKLSGWFSESFPSRWDEATIHNLLDTAFDWFGPDRLLAASNWPVSELAGPYSWVMHWVEDYFQAFPEPVRSKVLGDNAARVYRLGDSEIPVLARKPVVP